MRTRAKTPTVVVPLLAGLLGACGSRTALLDSTTAVAPADASTPPADVAAVVDSTMPDVDTDLGAEDTAVRLDTSVDVADTHVCAASTHACGDACVSDFDVATCGSSCAPCPGTTHGSAVCIDTGCAIACDDGYDLVSGACVLGAPRPISPLSTAAVTSRAPTLRWRLADVADGAHVELCADRACSVVTRSLDVVGSSTKLTSELAAGAHFWRLFTRMGGKTLSVPSPTWELFVGKRSAPIDTTFGTTLDVNGDGLADVAIASRNLVEPPGGSIGRIYVYQGSSGGLSKAPTTVIHGLKAGESFGATIASAGDVNGDGYGDLIAGANGGNRVYVFLGGPSGVSATPSATIHAPPGTRGSFGFSIASAGDVNGDGYGDIVVGALWYEDTVGRAYVFHGSAHGLLPTPATTLEAPAGGSWFGNSVAGGDFDGDGFGDVVVGAKFTKPGFAYVFLGSAKGVATKPANVLAGMSSTANYADTLALAGDVNGDGYADLLVGDEPDTVWYGHGYVHLGGPMGLSGTATALQPAEGHFSSSVGAAGDVDGDGYSDVVVGISMKSTVGVYLGGPSGTATTPASILTSSSYRFGYSVGRAGDIDGDGLSDVIVGSIVADISESGHAFIYGGTKTGVTSAPIRTYPAPDGFDFGHAVGGSTGP